MVADLPPKVPEAVHVAYRYWDMRPYCDGHLQLRAGPIPGSIIAIAERWRSGSTTFRCRITYDSTERWRWPKLCTATVHEVGHLLGHTHREGGVMRPVYRGPIKACRRGARGGAR